MSTGMQLSKLDTLCISICLQASSKIFTHYITGGALAVTFFYLELESVSFFQKSCTVSQISLFACRERVLLP